MSHMEDNRRALKLVRLLGAPILVSGGFLIYSGITTGVDAVGVDHVSVWWWLLEFVLSLGLLILGGLLVGLAYRLACRPTARALLCAAWVALFWLSGLLLSALQWLGLSPEPHSGVLFFGALAVAAILCTIGYWKLGKASGLLEADSRWWCQKTIHTLCGLVVFAMFILTGNVIEAAGDWGGVDDQYTYQVLVFLGWLALMAIVYQLGPPMLMRLTHVRPDASAATPAQKQETPPTIDKGIDPR